MWNTVLKYGAIAGVIVGVAVSALMAFAGDTMGHGAMAMAVTYAIMLVALSAVFLGVKHQRDVDGGGVIRFWPALGIGIAISVVAGVIYVAAWELAQATLIHGDFAKSYSDAMIAQQQAAGASATEIAKTQKEMAAFADLYRNPLFRLPMVFTEIFPVGVLVSLVSAALLRNPRFMAARA